MGAKHFQEWSCCMGLWLIFILPAMCLLWIDIDLHTQYLSIIDYNDGIRVTIWLILKVVLAKTFIRFQISLVEPTTWCKSDGERGRWYSVSVSVSLAYSVIPPSEHKLSASLYVAGFSLLNTHEGRHKTQVVFQLKLFLFSWQGLSFRSIVLIITQ